MDLITRLRESGQSVHFVDLGETDTCAHPDLASEAVAVAGRLHSLGVSPGDHVAIVLDNSRDAATALLAIWAAGATAVSVPPVPKGAIALRYAETFGAVLRRLNIRLLVGNEAVGRRIGSAVAERVSADDLRRTASAGDRDAQICPAPEIALVQFTSGSTGDPRGVAIRRETLEGHLDMISTALAADEGDAATSWLPLHHDMGLVGMFLTALWARRPLTLMTPRSFSRNPLAWLERCAATGTSITGAPNFAYRLATFGLRNGFFEGDLGSLRVCLCGAERVSLRVMTDFLDAAAPYGLPSTSIMPVYGLAEATLAVSFPPLGRDLRAAEGDTVSVGALLPGVEATIADVDELGRGELLLRGRWMLDHYVTSDGEVSALDEDGWYHTNDIVSIDHGELVVHGRSDEVAIVRGRNLYAEDVESVVAAVAGDRFGFHAAFRLEDSFAVAGEWLGIDDTNPKELVSAIRRAVASELGAALHSVRVCRPQTLPLTTSGKVKRARCRTMVEMGEWPDASILLAG